jgi:hypothetical protein
MNQTLMLGRSWQLKRVVITRDMIAIGRANDESETLLDAIPFVEIDSVREMLGDDSSNLDRKSGKFLNAFMMTTVSDGHNCGRTYYLQAASPEMYTEVVQHLNRNKKEAWKRAEFNTRFAKSQYWVRKIFRSRIFQNFAALLITLVRQGHSQLSHPDSSGMSFNLSLTRFS